MQVRENALNDWLKININLPEYTLSLLSGDASFRRYFRLLSHDNSYVIMDAPPDKESIKEFLLVARFLKNNGLAAPKVYASDLQQGFIMLEDFGDNQFLKVTQGRVNKLDFYKNAIDALLKLQLTEPSELNLPKMNREFYWRELTLFKVWFLSGYLNLELSQSETTMIDSFFKKLIEELLAIPTCLVHRDYHSRNLMVLDANKLGILDFQDAIIGPVTYDLVSLLRDCYIKLSPQELDWCLNYYNDNFKFKNKIDWSLLKKSFDITGLQRHLKVLGIFSRLYLRDGKINYLQDIPLTLTYVQEALASQTRFQQFAEFIKNRVRLP
jgi:aminoglycoside/choline kinase family phosphotransferase